MTGRAGPTHETLVENLERRVLEIEGPEGLERRFNRIGVPRRSVEDNVLEKRYNRIGVPKKSVKAASAGSASLASLKKGKNNKAKGGKAAAGSQPAAVPAAGVTNANTPSTGDSLGRDIE